MNTKKFSRVLIANRGEIALRIIRACRELGLETILAVSEADRKSLPAKMADKVICIGPPRPIQSYLQVDTLISVALNSGAEAIHPGYGFLAERPEFPEACEKQGLVFIGPKAEHIRRMGDKIQARWMARELGVPVIPGSKQIRTPGEAEEAAEQLGYPVLIKAAAGGGGRGMKLVAKAEDLKTGFTEAAAEARSAFGDDRLFMEHYIMNARHIEVQVMGDHWGNLRHFFERDCSLQRRHQKMLEEAPCLVLTPDMRGELFNAALTLARHIRYLSAGTVEFIWDQDLKKFYFLEMNTRIQVEHPVTEMITGVDLVKEQIRIAGGGKIAYAQEEITFNGHAIECRITAESPEERFRPCPGEIREWKAPADPYIRLDTHCYAGYFVPPYYDSLLAKLIAKGRSRSEAISSMDRALREFQISGIETTIPFYRKIMNDDCYRRGEINTTWIEDALLPLQAGNRG
ncbi:MAG: accC 1 [Deltaproteobacteria bacterium]|nr:accC 1 [Deltaproteobacteria bacterium]